MKKILLLLLLSFCLISCGVSKKFQKSKTDINEALKVQTTQKDSTIIDSISITQDSTISTIKVNTLEVIESKTDDEVTTTIREYDTNKPLTDSGKPPLKKEIVHTRRKVDNKKALTDKVVSNNKESKTINLTETSHITTKEKTVDKVKQTNTHIDDEQSTKKGLNVIQRILCWFGGVALLALIIWVVMRFKR